MRTEEGGDTAPTRFLERFFANATLTVLRADDLKEAPEIDDLEMVSPRQVHRIEGEIMAALTRRKRRRALEDFQGNDLRPIVHLV